MRPAAAADVVGCALLDASYTTGYVWQLDTRPDGEDLRVSFRLVRLPRELTLAFAHCPPAGPRRGLLWLAAEETTVVEGSAPAAGGEELPAHDRPAKIAGYIVVAAAPRSETAYVQSLVVGPPYRRKGLAARLLLEARRWAAAQGADRLMADIAARNYPAMRFLQKAGFAFCGFNDRCYPDNEVAVFFSMDL